MEIVPEIAEVKLPEDQQSGDVLPFQECEITVDAHIDVPMIHGRMIYRCEHCGKSWPMYLERALRSSEKITSRLPSRSPARTAADGPWTFRGF